MVANGVLLLPPSSWVIPGRGSHVLTPQCAMVSPQSWIRPEPLALFGSGRRGDAGANFDPEDHWRLFAGRGVRYLDIETTGLSRDAQITMVGVSDGQNTVTLVAGQTLSAESLRLALSGARLLVTFNGVRFDVPRLRAAFPGLDWSVPHFDLAREGHAVGLGGGLKALERRFDLPRDPAVESCDGSLAPELWARAEDGDTLALTRLRRYCRADVEGLVHLAPKVFQRLAGAFRATA